MNLGNILSSSVGEPCASRRIEFHLMRQTPQGRQRYRVEAVLFPVSEADRQAARRDAVAFLRTLPEYREQEGLDHVPRVPLIPQAVIDNEALIKFLAYALHDVDNPIVKFVDSQSYGRFRDGITVEQLAWLNRTYERFIEDEYPELAPDMADLEEQALGK